MSRDPKRDLLLAKLYSREGATSVARDYVDPDSGKVLHLSPDEWKLLQYDRTHAGGAVSPLHTATESDAAVGGLPDSQAANADSSRYSSVAPGAHRHRPSRRRVAIGIALLVVGSLVGGAVAIGAAHLQPGMFGLAGRPETSAPTGAIDAVFSSGDFSLVDPGKLAAIGFRRDSFRMIGDDLVYDRTGQIYAARRNDGAYCLVLVTALVPTADTCASAVDIGRVGLTLTDTTREADGTLLTFTASWNRNGQITWNLVENSH